MSEAINGVLIASVYGFCAGAVVGLLVILYLAINYFFLYTNNSLIDGYRNLSEGHGQLADGYVEFGQSYKEIMEYYRAIDRAQNALAEQQQQVAEEQRNSRELLARTVRAVNESQKQMEEQGQPPVKPVA